VNTGSGVPDHAFLELFEEGSTKISLILKMKMVIPQSWTTHLRVKKTC
jgi:hypothetical protein